MPKPIVPALSAEQWKEYQKNDRRRLTVSGFGAVVGGMKALTPEASIALNNDQLEPDDPRKITRSMMGDLRLAAGRLVRSGDVLGVTIQGHVDALEAYLPPEGA